jgi:tetratricopeptide (TPR) repeat protein
MRDARHRVRSALTAAVIALLAPGLHADSRICAGCHPKEWQTYSRTGMARSFYRPNAANTIEDYSDRNAYYHRASDTHFEMIRRDGKYFQRQYQTGFDGKQTNVSEKQVDYVIGSGNHVRTYLHRTPANTLVEMPLAWYSEKGGYWAMNPGYDRPDHQGFRRNVTYDCMFCHNAYPQIPASLDGPRSLPAFTSLPEGIDCGRCHGKGEKHIGVASKPNARPQDIREAIVNPARLTPERQMDVCLQCHLQSTSSSLPPSIVRYERGPFSYQPGEALGEFMLHFDSIGANDRFEISGSAYRLRQSRCFRESEGKLTCLTCHDPHNASPAGDTACLRCHNEALARLVSANRHTAAKDCVGCHMPKRRTDDVVHAVMTDHYIQRTRPARDLLAEAPERLQTDANAYRGEIALYYPVSLPHPEDALYLAIAQVVQQSNLARGIPQLAEAIDRFRPAAAEYYLQLGDALRSSGQFERSIPAYEEAVRREPQSAAGLERLALGSASVKEYSRAEAILKQVIERSPAAGAWVELGVIEGQQGKLRDAVAAFENAIQIDPEMADAYNSAGAIQFEMGNAKDAEAMLRGALRIQPNYAAAHNNLGNLLSSSGRFEEARYHFEEALLLKDSYTGARYNYALALFRVQRFDEAQKQLEEILRIDPGSAEVHEFLGNILAAKGELGGAIRQYEEALRIAPGFSKAELDLGSALVRSGNLAAALPHLNAAASAQDPATRDEALKVLEMLKKP